MAMYWIRNIGASAAHKIEAHSIRFDDNAVRFFDEAVNLIAAIVLPEGGYVVKEENFHPQR